jgi:hypothetical protein
VEEGAVLEGAAVGAVADGAVVGASVDDGDAAGADALAVAEVLGEAAGTDADGDAGDVVDAAGDGVEVSAGEQALSSSAPRTSTGTTRRSESDMEVLRPSA